MQIKMYFSAKNRIHSIIGYTYTELATPIRTWISHFLAHKKGHP